MKALSVVLITATTVTACAGDEGSNPGPVFTDEHPRVYLAKNKDRLSMALAEGKPEAMRFAAMVNRWIADPVEADIYDFREWYAALMGQLTGDAKYCKAAVASLDTWIKEEEATIASGGTPFVVNDSYLGIGAQVGNIALTYDFCFAEVGARRAAWLSYANQAVWNVWHHMEAEWGGRTVDWSGWSVDNPVNNYYYSFLRATMLLGLVAHGEIPDADTWLTQYRNAKIGDQLVPVFEADLQGGGSREGTGYGVSMRNLFETFDMWEASTGEDLSRETAHTRDSMLAMMHSTVPTLDRQAPIGDHTRDSSAALFDYHRQYLVELMHLFPDDPVTGFVRSFLDESSVPEMDQQFMYVYDFFYPSDKVAAQPLANLNTAYWAEGIGNLYARSSWDKDATWVGMVAGPFTESHAHQDQGSILIYKDEWLGYDPNTESRSGIRLENEAHNLVRITDGGTTIEQKDQTTSKMLALHQGPGYLHAAADLTPAYRGDPKIQKVQREMVFLHPDIVVIYDRVMTSPGTQQLWQMTSPVAAAMSGTTATITGSKRSLKIQNVVPGADATGMHSFIDDDAEDYRGGFRFDFPQDGGDRRFLTVMSIGNTVSSVTANGSDGVTIQLAAGGTASMTFSHDGVGGTLTPPGGSAITLGAGVDKLPE